MKIELLKLLVCPKSNQSLYLEDEDNQNHEEDIKTGFLVSEDGTNRYPIINGIPRFVPETNYADNFGMQWNQFSRTQLDSYCGQPISADRFWLATNWSPDQLKDKWVLDVGCGAGRFAEVALIAGANVVALDYSYAVDACYENLKEYPNLHVIQGDIYKLPFANNTFPFVYSLGVLQHTPDVANAFACLPPLVEEGGKLCVDYYWKRFRTMFHAKYIFRPITKRMNQQKLFVLLEKWVPSMLLLSQTIGRIPYIGKVFKRLIPIADYTGQHPLTSEQLKEWALLDTFDMLAPAYDNPQTAKTARRWFEEAKFIDIEIGHWSHLGARGRKPNKS